MGRGDQPERPACPRCGYDQTGVVDSWRESCPLAGVCSECGLEFPWCEVLNPLLNRLPWLFEHARGPGVRAWVATGARALYPVRFWTRLRLTHTVRVRRLLVFAASLVLIAHLSISGLTAWRAYAAAVASRPPVWTRFVPGTGMVRTRPPAPTQSDVVSTFGGQIGLLVAWPYGRRALIPPPSATPGPFWTGVYFEPVLGLWLVGLSVFTFAVPPGFLALGETFRRCRVRFVHLLRGAVYSLVGPAATVALAVVPSGMGEGIATLLSGVCVVWLAVFWLVFVTEYLRLTHGVWVVVSMLIIAGLATTIVCTLAWAYGMRGIM